MRRRTLLPRKTSGKDDLQSTTERERGKQGSSDKPNGDSEGTMLDGHFGPEEQVMEGYRWGLSKPVLASIPTLSRSNRVLSAKVPCLPVSGLPVPSL